MKKIISAFISGLLLSGLFAFTVTNYEINKSTAEVNQILGYYVFVDSKPLKEYKYLGTVDKAMSWGSGQYQDVRDAILRKARKKYPEANGLIFHFKDGGTDSVDVIQFE